MSAPASVRAARLLYRLALRLLPGAIRPHRAEMEALFGRMAADAHLRGGARGVLALAAVEALDILGTAVRERGRRVVATLPELRFAARRLRRHPGFAVTALLSLALVIGGNAAVFSVVNAVLLRDPALERPEELVDLYYAGGGLEYSTMSYPDYADLRDATGDVFSGILASRFQFAPWERPGDVQVLTAELVTGSYFDVQGIRPAAGRLIGPGDDVARGAHPVAVLSWPFWQRAFAGDAGVVGEEMRLGGRAYTILGVAERDWSGLVRGVVADVYLPMTMTNALLPQGFDALAERGNRASFARARLLPDVTHEEARTVLGAVTEEQRRRYPDSWTVENEFHMVPTAEVVVNPMIDPYLKAAGAALVGLVVLVLLVACANLASFLLAQAADRRREIAVRLALGAERGSLVRQLMTETLLLALAGGAVGLGLSIVATRLLMAADLPLPIPITLDLRPDVPVLAWTLGVTVAAGLLFGLAPALHGTRTPVAATLRDESTGGGGGRSRLRAALVVAQVAVSVVCLVAAGLFARNLAARQALDPGFGQAPTALLQIAVPPERLEEDPGTWLRAVSARLEAVDGVEAVGFTSNLQLDQTNRNLTDVAVPGVAPPEGLSGHAVDVADVDPGFFRTLGIPIVAGRAFDERDAPGGMRVAIVSEAMARRFWPAGDAVGSTFRTESGAEVTVVGVAGDTKVRSLGEPPTPFLYYPAYRSMGSFMWVVARVRGDAARALEPLLAAVRAQDAEVRVVRTATMDRHMDILLLPARLAAWAFGAFAALALLLAVVGLYGIVSYAVARRSREMGIRLSLGAAPGSVVRLLMRSGLVLVAGGSVLGLLAAAALAGALSRLLFHVQALDPVTFVGVPLVLALVAALAAWLPARRAARVDPAVALRAD